MPHAAGRALVHRQAPPPPAPLRGRAPGRGGAACLDYEAAAWSSLDPAPVDVRDPAAVSSWLASVQGIVEELHTVSMDQTQKAPHRRNARGHARGILRRCEGSRSMSVRCPRSVSATGCPAPSRGGTARGTGCGCRSRATPPVGGEPTPRGPLTSRRWSTSRAWSTSRRRSSSSPGSAGASRRAGHPPCRPWLGRGGARRRGLDGANPELDVLERSAPRAPRSWPFSCGVHRGRFREQFAYMRAVELVRRARRTRRGASMTVLASGRLPLPEVR
jgi:hypothetical protein